MNFYVSTTGDDGNDGAIGTPFASLGRAKTAVRAAVAAGLTEPVSVYFRTGTYRLSAVATFGPEDSGTPEFPVSWSSYPGESATISGGLEATGWSLVSGSIYRANVGTASFRQIYANGTHAQRARGALNPAGWVRGADGYGAPDSSIAGWGNVTDVEIVSLGSWAMNRAKVSSASGANVFMNGNTSWAIQESIRSGYSIRATPSWVENAYELMASGYWYLNKATGFLYYWPPSGSMSGITVTYPIVDGNLLSFSGASNINFSALTIADTTWTGPDSTVGYIGIQGGDFFNSPNSPWSPSIASTQPGAVDIDGCSNVKIQSNLFTRCGSTCVLVHGGSSDVRVEFNRFTENAAGGVYVGHGAEFPVQESRITIRGNVYDSGNEFDLTDAGAFHVACAVDGEIKNNTIKGSRWAGINIGWYGDAEAYCSRCEISENWIQSACSEYTDGTAIYVRASQSALGTLADGLTIQRNRVDSVPTGQGAIYLDNYAAWVTAFDNVFRGVTYWLFDFAANVHDCAMDGNYSSTTSKLVNGTNVTSGSLATITAAEQANTTRWGKIMHAAGIPVGVVAGLPAAPREFLVSTKSTRDKLRSVFGSVPSRGITGIFDLHEGLGAFAFDQFGSRIGAWSGTKTGTNGYYSAGPFERQAATFDGSTNFIDLQNAASPIIPSTGNWTITGWVKSHATNPNPYIISQYRANSAASEDGGMLIYLNGAGPFKLAATIGTYGGATKRTILSTGTFAANTWAFFALSRNGGFFSLYLNGNAADTASDADATRQMQQQGNIIGGVGAVNMSTYNNVNFFFRGQISGVCVYNVALTAEEIRGAWIAGK